MHNLSMRPSGRQAILKLSTVVREINDIKRETNKSWRLRRDKQAEFLARKATRSKGYVTKARNKLRQIETLNKGLQTKLTKVRRSRTHVHSCLITLFIHIQLRQNAKQSIAAVKESEELSKKLKKQVWRERYLHKKALRVAEDAVEDASKVADIFCIQMEEKDQQICEHEKEILASPRNC